MSFSSTILNPFKFFKSTPDATSHPSLSTDRFQSLKQSYDTFNSNNIISTITWKVDKGDVSQLSRAFIQPFEAESIKCISGIQPQITFEAFATYAMDNYKLAIKPLHPHLIVQFNQALFAYLAQALPAEFTILANPKAKKTTKEETISKLQQLIAAFSLAVSSKPIASQFIWYQCVAHGLVLLQYNEDGVKTAHETFTATQPSSLTVKEKALACFPQLFSSPTLTDVANAIVSTEPLVKAISGVFKRVQTLFEALNKSKSTPPPPPTTEQPATEPDDEKSIDHELFGPSSGQIEANKHRKFVEANYIWTPTPEDISYAISQLHVGQVRFGVIQGLSKDGIFVDTFQNHVKIRVMCPFGNIYDNKVMKKNAERRVQTTKPLNRDKKWSEADGGHDAYLFPPDLVMRYANKEYHIGDRVSFVIQKITPTTSSKGGAPRIYISFATTHFATLAPKYAKSVTKMFKYLLKLKYDSIKARLLQSRTIPFFPPRFLEQVEQNPTLSQFLSEFNVIDHKILTMKLTSVEKDFAEKWLAAHKIPSFDPRNSKKPTSDDDSAEGVGNGGDEDSEEELDEKSVGKDLQMAPSDTSSDSNSDSDSNLTEDDEPTRDGEDSKDDTDNKQHHEPPEYRNDPLLHQYFHGSVLNIAQHQNLAIFGGMTTRSVSGFHGNNAFSFKHRHISPGIDNVAMTQTSKVNMVKFKSTISSYSDKDFSKIYLQSLNMLRNLMSFQPFPKSSKLFVNAKSLDYSFATDPKRHEKLAEFFCDQELYHYYVTTGATHHRHAKNLVYRVKSKQFSIIAHSIDVMGKKANMIKQPVQEYDFATVDDLLYTAITTMDRSQEPQISTSRVVQEAKDIIDSKPQKEEKVKESKPKQQTSTPTTSLPDTPTPQQPKPQQQSSKAAQPKGSQTKPQQHNKQPQQSQPLHNQQPKPKQNNITEPNISQPQKRLNTGQKKANSDELVQLPPTQPTKITKPRKQPQHNHTNGKKTQSQDGQKASKVRPLPQ